MRPTSGYYALITALVSLIALTSQVPAHAEDAKPAHNLAEGDNPALDEKALQGASKNRESSDSTTANWSGLNSTVEKLVKEYYPIAKIQTGKEQMHVLYKNKPFILPSTNKAEQGPDWGGIVFDMELKPGPYAGVHQVPKKFNEYSFYSVELFAPYSKKYDRHLLTRICYPFDVAPEFLKRFKKVVEDFEQYL